MTLSPWRSPLARALHRNRSLPYVRYLQLATVRPDGRPANRTVVFRGFLDGTDQLKFAIDRRSQKAEQIPLQAWGEGCWYFPKTREQFRLFGKLTLVSADPPDLELSQARTRLWQDLSDAGRIQFAWAQPGAPRAAAETFTPPPPDAEMPLPNFCLLLLDPEQVDHLELRGDPQNRYLYDRIYEQTQSQTASTWSVQSVNP
jgi:pyridoxamine 5'-phosphate oxidase